VVLAAFSRVNAVVREAALKRLGWDPLISAAALRRHVQETCPSSPVPNIQSFERLVKEYRERNPEPWDLVTASHEELGPVVAVLAVIADDPFLRERVPSRAEAAWVARLTAGAPDLPPALAFTLAIRAVRDPDVVPDLTRVLAFAPWRDKGQRLAEAIRIGLADRRLAMLAGYATEVETYLQTAAHPKVGKAARKETGE